MRPEEIKNNLIDKYSTTLGISPEVAEEIILNNETMKTFVQQQIGILLVGENKCLSLLLRGTLGRKMYDFKPITGREKELIKEIYNIEIK